MLKTCSKCGGRGKVLDDKTVGIGLRKQRDKKGITLKQVAGQMGKSVSYISDLEHGRRGWSIELKSKYLEALQ